MGRRLGRIVVVPFATIGIVSALLVWEIEHVGSIALAILLGTIAVGIGVLVARHVRTQIEELATYYETLLRTAEAASARAESAGRIKDEFLSTLSHELRTPLNSILGWARLLEGGKLDAAQSARAIQAIERAGWAQSQLIEDLLDASRIVSGRLQISPVPTLLQPIITFVVLSLGPAAVAKGIRVETHLDSAIGRIAADPDRLQQIAWHLVSNAIKFTPTDGQVVVELSLRNQHVCLSVTDTGVGFSDETASLLFERFRQGDGSSTRPFGGLGLGLGIVRHLTEMHGGTVSARSAGPGHGSTFEVLLPQRPVTAPVPPAEPAVEPSPLLDGVSVLVVDDDAKALEFARSSLERFGASVVTAQSADEGRHHLTATPPDVLLSDRLPGDHGYQFIQSVRALDRQRGRHTPAAAFTGLARAADRRDALAAGYEMHVVKPIDPFELAMAVDQLVKAG
ncbi:MAG: hybrid sensor histidine kinase/response regulator [Vicinamibacterales bacterium]